MKSFVAVVGLSILASNLAGAAEQPRLLTKVTPLPVALDKNFEFRKTKLYFLSPKAERIRSHYNPSEQGQVGGVTPFSKSATVQDASITFERQYRLFGAVTELDKNQRWGNYFDFYWRCKKPADVTVRLEYRQEKLHAHVQAQEISYSNVRGTHKTEFKVIGDDFLDDGRVIAWRCLLIANGTIVAENRSFLWE